MTRLLLLLALWLLPATAAFGHAALIDSRPADGARLDSAPAEASLTFNEPVTVMALTYRLPDGTTVSLDKATAAAAVLTTALPNSRVDGPHVLTYRVVSADGHPVSGSIVLLVGTASAGADAAVTDPSPMLPGATWAARLILLAALAFGVGGVFHARAIGTDKGETAPGTRLLLVAGLLALPATAGFAGLDLIGAPPAALLGPDPFAATLRTSLGTSLALAGLALLLALAALRAPRGAGRILGAAAVLSVGGALAASGHAATAEPVIATRTALVLHGVALTVWLGALPALARDLARGETAALARFSAIAPAAVGALLAGGLLLAVVQMRAPSDLIETAWGRVLAVKLLLVAGLLALAALNRWRWTGPVRTGSPVAARRMRRSIGVEILLGLAILGLVGLWRQTPPPRVLAIAESVAARPASVHLHGVGAMANVTITPGRAGPVRLEAEIFDGDGAPILPQAVSLRLSQTDAGIAPIARDLTMGPDGFWIAPDLVLPTGGRWSIELAVLVSDFDLQRIAAEVDMSD